MASQPPPPPTAPFGAIFWDFDGTISASIWVDRLGGWAVSDSGRRHIVEGLTADETRLNFGGAERIAALHTALTALRKLNVRQIIISHGLSAVIRPHLAQVGLEGLFDEIYGSDSPELRECGGGHSDKARLIAKRMAKLQLRRTRCVFIEDTDANLQPARDNNVCECWLVNRGEGGISVAKLDELAATFAALAQNVQ